MGNLEFSLGQANSNSENLTPVSKQQAILTRGRAGENC